VRDVSSPASFNRSPDRHIEAMVRRVAVRVTTAQYHRDGNVVALRVDFLRFGEADSPVVVPGEMLSDGPREGQTRSEVPSDADLDIATGGVLRSQIEVDPPVEYRGIGNGLRQILEPERGRVRECS